MPNTLLTISDVLNELLMRFENNTVMVKYVLLNLDNTGENQRAYRSKRIPFAEVKVGDDIQLSIKLKSGQPMVARIMGYFGRVAGGKK